MQWWNPTQLYFGDYFISHEIRIPAWTNQDSMEFRNVIRKNRAPTSYKMELWCPYKWGKNQWVCLGVPTSGVKLTKRTLLNWPQSPISRLPTSLTLQHVLCLFGWWSANGIPRNPTKCLRINEGRKTGWVNLSTVEDHRIFQFFEKWHKRRVQELFGGEFQSGRFFKRTSGARFWILGGTRKFCSHLHLNRPFGIGDQLQMSSPWYWHFSWLSPKVAKAAVSFFSGRWEVKCVAPLYLPLFSNDSHFEREVLPLLWTRSPG